MPLFTNDLCPKATLVLPHYALASSSGHVLRGLNFDQDFFYTPPFLCFLRRGMLRNISGFSHQSVHRNQTYFVLLFLQRRLFCCFRDVSVNELTTATQLLRQGPTKVSSSLSGADSGRDDSPLTSFSLRLSSRGWGETYLLQLGLHQTNLSCLNCSVIFSIFLSGESLQMQSGRRTGCSLFLLNYFCPPVFSSNKSINVILALVLALS